VPDRFALGFLAAEKAYRALLSGLADDLTLGLTAGMAVSIGFDLFMGANSLIRRFSGRLSGKVCPIVVAVTHDMAATINRLGLAAPTAFSEMRCKLSGT
jgi:hypothetical protein